MLKHFKKKTRNHADSIKLDDIGCIETQFQINDTFQLFRKNTMRRTIAEKCCHLTRRIA